VTIAQYALWLEKWTSVIYSTNVSQY